MFSRKLLAFSALLPLTLALAAAGTPALPAKTAGPMAPTQSQAVASSLVYGLLSDSQYAYRPRVLTWVESTRLAVDGFFDRDRAYGWVTNLGDAKPVESASVSIWPDRVSGRTDGHGLAMLALPEAQAPTKERARRACSRGSSGGGAPSIRTFASR